MPLIGFWHHTFLGTVFQVIKRFVLTSVFLRSLSPTQSITDGRMDGWQRSRPVGRASEKRSPPLAHAFALPSDMPPYSSDDGILRSTRTCSYVRTPASCCSNNHSGTEAVASCIRPPAARPTGRPAAGERSADGRMGDARGKARDTTSPHSSSTDEVGIRGGRPARVLKRIGRSVGRALGRLLPAAFCLTAVEKRPAGRTDGRGWMMRALGRRDRRSAGRRPTHRERVRARSLARSLVAQRSSTGRSAPAGRPTGGRTERSRSADRTGERPQRASERASEQASGRSSHRLPRIWPLVRPSVRPTDRQPVLVRSALDSIPLPFRRSAGSLLLGSPTDRGHTTWRPSVRVRSLLVVGCPKSVRRPSATLGSALGREASPATPLIGSILFDGDRPVGRAIDTHIYGTARDHIDGVPARGRRRLITLVEQTS